MTTENIAKPVPLGPISLKHYTIAVSQLIELANKDVGGSRVAAQVLLSLSIGDDFHVDLTELCLLDDHYYQAAMIAIRGRVEFRYEPHEMIEGGGKIFEQLWDDWKHLRVANRYAKHYQK
jgi:hypothetical protein